MWIPEKARDRYKKRQKWNQAERRAKKKVDLCTT
jgi:hypothetical protein